MTLRTYQERLERAAEVERDLAERLAKAEAQIELLREEKDRVEAGLRLRVSDLVEQNAELREDVAHKERANEILEKALSEARAEVGELMRANHALHERQCVLDAETARLHKAHDDWKEATADLAVARSEKHMLDDALCKAWEYIACLRDEGEVPDSDHFQREAQEAAVACGLNTTEISASINAPGRKLATSPASAQPRCRK